ncbi:MAG: M48 family metalloprotease [Saprospiraceae bacterium]
MTAHFQQLLFILCVSVFFSSPIFGQLSDDYTPIELRGEIPADFLKRIKSNVKLKYHNSLRLNTLQKKQFDIATEYALREIFQNGNIYFNDPLTDYVRKVGDHILYNSDLKNDITFFVSRFNTPNATTWQDGSIIVNIGLLSKLENEAQLAFALAHEVSHFIQQHPYLQYGRFVKKKGETIDTSQPFIQSLDRTLNYELEADSIAISLMSKANYNYHEGSKVLRILKGDYEKETIDFMTYFSSDKFEVTQKFLCKPISYRDYMEAEEVNQKTILSTDIRQRRLIQHLSRVEFIPDLKLNILSQKLFEKIKAIAHFEMVEQSFRESNFLRSTYEALVLLNQYPDNKYLNIKVCENLYYLNSYHEMYIMNRVFFDQKKIEDDEYADFCCFINKINQDDMRRMVSGLVKKQYQNYPSDERMLIIMAKTVEAMHDMKYAKSYYERYVKLFPDGEHFISAKKKLEQN